MSEARTTSGTVHWIGTGLSTGVGVNLLADRAGALHLWGRTVQKAAACLDRLGLTGRATPQAYQPDGLAERIAAGDVVVSMLPAGEHPTVLGRCIERGAHFACTSYVAPDLVELAPAAERTGLVVLTEAGLDPGIDHLFADDLVARARREAGEKPATVAFTSYCGGIPAVPNDFRYRFSWAPRGVLGALRQPARYLEDGQERLAPQPWEYTRPETVGGETFQVYPNRDSLPYVEQYGIPPTWRLTTFVRGTVRLAGWREAWAPVFEELAAGDPDRIGALADELARRYPTTAEDRDRVILAVHLRVDPDGGPSWSGGYQLDLVGDRDSSAMARCVSIPLACGVIAILDGALPAGLRRAADGQAPQRWLSFLREHGIAFQATGDAATVQPGQGNVRSGRVPGHGRPL
jgi:saccharopine dehydrogenase-like protein